MHHRFFNLIIINSQNKDLFTIIDYGHFWFDFYAVLSAFCSIPGWDVMCEIEREEFKKILKKLED